MSEPEDKRSRCFICGMAYDDPRWVECVVADEVWMKISPTGDEGGLLCVQCMANRVVCEGLGSVSAKFISGPLISDDISFSACSLRRVRHERGYPPTQYPSYTEESK